MSDFLPAIYGYLETLPRSAQLDFYDLPRAQRELLRAMISHSKGGEGKRCARPLEDYGRRAGLSRRTLQRALHGYTDKRTGVHHAGLMSRNILRQVAAASRTQMRPAAYQVNWYALKVDPNKVGILERMVQQNLPGISSSSKSEFTGGAEHPSSHRDQCHQSPCPTPPVTVTTMVVEGSNKAEIGGVRAPALTTYEKLVQQTAPDLYRSLAGSDSGISVNSFAEDVARKRGWSGKPIIDGIATAVQFYVDRGCAMDSQMAAALLLAYDEAQRTTKYQLLPQTFFQSGMYQKWLRPGRSGSA